MVLEDSGHQPIVPASLAAFGVWALPSKPKTLKPKPRTLSIKIAQKPCIIGSLGPKSLKT